MRILKMFSGGIDVVSLETRMCRVCSSAERRKERKDVAMRKLCFVLTALLLAVPAMATVDIECAQVGTTADVEVTYDATSDGNVPRAFGLDITVDSGATIDALVSDSDEYWVHPGRIVITDGNLISEANALAVTGSTGALGGLGTGGITVEMGSLWDESDTSHPNQPPLSGVLLTFTVSGDCNITIAGNAARGNVVLESTAEADVSYTGCAVALSTDCYTGPDFAEWVARGRPSCWCTPHQCYGDAAGDKSGNSKKGYYYVGTTDLQILIDGWIKREPPKGSGIIGRTGTGGVQLECADVAHDKSGNSKKGYYYVGTTDLQVVIDNWIRREPPKGSGIPSDCNP